MLNKTKSRKTNRPLLQPGSDLIGEGDGQSGGGDRQGDGGAIRARGHHHGLQRLRLQEFRPIDGAAVNHFDREINKNLK